jgi:hypothetical protein
MGALLALQFGGRLKVPPSFDLSHEKLEKDIGTRDLGFMVHQLRTGLLGTTLTAALLWLATVEVSFAQIMPAPADLAAKVMDMTGRVSVLRDSEEWALNVGDSVQVKQVIVTGPDGFARFQVSDGSTFEVYPNSTVTFRNSGASNWRDLLDVFVGRVKIHIQRWGGQPNPNRIHTPTAVISVRGTTFDVSVDPDNETTLVAVEEGAVDVRHAIKGGETKTVNAGESIQVYKNQPLANQFVDRGVVAQRIFKALEEALYTIATNSRAGRIGSLGTDPGSGSTKAPPPPPPPVVVAPPH